MTAKQFFNWQTAGGAGDVMKLVDALERADVAWCVIGGLAVNHWPEEPMVTQDVDLVVASDDLERAVTADVHGILMRVASLNDTLDGKIRAWSRPILSFGKSSPQNCTRRSGNQTDRRNRP